MAECQIKAEMEIWEDLLVIEEELSRDYASGQTSSATGFREQIQEQYYNRLAELGYSKEKVEWYVWVILNVGVDPKRPWWD